MHDFLHVEHLFFDLPSDFKYFVKIVNLCTNYLANSLSDFSEIVPQIVKNAYLRIPIFKISRGACPRTPLEGTRAGPRRDRVAITSFGVLEFHPPPPPPRRDSNPGSATAALDGIRTCISGIRAHCASDYTMTAGTPPISRNKHFRHSPASSIVKQSCMKHSNSYLLDRYVKHLQGPPLSQTRRVRERRKIELMV